MRALESLDSLDQSSKFAGEIAWSYRSEILKDDWSMLQPSGLMANK